MKHANGHHIHHVKHNGTSSSASKHSKSKWTWDDSIPVPRLSYHTSAVIVFVLAVGCFINSYNGDFVFDDSEAVLTNDDLKPSTPVVDLFKHDFWGNKLDSKTSHKSYRPLTVLTFRWSHSLGGGANPTAFHIPNILLHGAVCVAMLTMFSLIVAGCHFDGDGNFEFGAPKTSLLCAILFAVHPIHTESVAGVVGRADLLCALLFVLSFISYVKSCVAGTDYTRTNMLYRPETFSVPYFIISMVICALSVLCKEQGITVIESIPLWRRSLIVRQCFLVIAGLTILITRWRVMGSAPPTFQVFDNPHSFVNGTLLRTLNYNYLYSLNFWLLLNPWWLCFDWSMGSIPVISSVSDLRILAVLAFWSGLISAIYFSLSHTEHINRTMTMALALLIVPFLPGTNLFFRVGFVIAERVLYLSTAGFCIWVVLGIQILSKSSEFSQICKYGFYFLLFTFVIRSVQRSHEWKDEMSLFTSGAKVCPLNAKVHYNIAKIHADRGKAEAAIDRYRHAISLNPTYDQAMNNLGNLLKDRGQEVEAERLLAKAVEIRPEFAAAWMNLGIVQAALKKHKAAEKSYYTALTHRRKYPDCYYNLGNLYLDLQQNELAIFAWRNATLQKPTHDKAWSNMIILYDSLDLLDKAEAAGKEAIKYIPQDPSIYFNLANVMGKADRHRESEQYFLKAIKLHGKIVPAKVYTNLGVLYHRWGKREEAEKAYRKALQIEPNNQNTLANLQMLQQKYGQ
ncbi:hypothetical protein FSP39_015624 [Pinctada imbricata]|uniref:dolichyl-phosphate-mannose--protein mannosyltransferase n=1 Tax=Pinctada imbricata TaxID=66713 RepID=A0AA89C1I6_PINIB|nr:hypothetical protein FSP39_015624 [Pinctada imbricata]